MPDDVDTVALARLLERSRDALRDMSARLRAQSAAPAEPVAVIGMGCRLPGGAASPQEFWDLLKAGRDCVRAIGSRWDQAGLGAAADQIYVREAALLEGDVGAFDAGFFGVSAAEASDLDPQQRLLLEVSWEALEHAGLAPGGLRGSRTGVFVGIVGCEYGMLPRDTTRLGPFAGTGTLASLAAGRLSYFLGLHGPSLAIDTACSSSLVALHYACESLRRGECDLALAGGVNLLLSPLPMLSLCRTGALAPDGRCKTFDAAGDGYGRGEGCGVVVLRRLDAARAQRDPVHAVILGSSINHDGRSGGLTVPNGAAQRQLVDQALKRAAVNPAEVGYVEAHGTGTSLGDPIEVQALAEVLGPGRAPDNVLRIGSVKTNIGHLEAAAGIAGVIKATLCLSAQAIPPHLHLREPNPRLALERIPATIPQALLPWTSSGRRVAGVSAFGFSGTNAHVVLAEAPARPPATRAAAGEALLVLSARSAPALSEQCARLGAHLRAHPEHDLHDVCLTAAVGRTHFEHRRAFVVASREELLARLEAAEHAGPLAGPRRPVAGRLALWLGGVPAHFDASALASAWPAFQAQIESAARWPGPPVSDPARAFATHYAWARAWSSLGLRITSVVGAGEAALVALAVAGVAAPRALAALLAGETGASQTAVDLHDGELRVVSTLAGATWPAGTRTLGALWEAERASGPRHPQAAARALREAGHTRVLALADDGSFASCCQAEGLEVLTVGDGWGGVLHAMAALYEAGVQVDWAAFHAGSVAERLALPTYPFQRTHYWIETPSAPASSAAARVTPAEGPSGRRLLSPLRQIQVEHELSVAALPELRDTPVLHAGYYLELLARGLRDGLALEAFLLQEMRFLVALELPADGVQRVQLVLDPNGDQVEFEFWAWQAAERRWLRHVSGRVSSNLASVPQAVDAGVWPAMSGTVAPGADFYADLARRGVELGPSARWVDSVVSAAAGQALARLRVPPGTPVRTGGALGVPPGLYEACLQVFHAALPPGTAADVRFMAVRLSALRCEVGVPAGDGWSCRATITHGPGPDRLLHGRIELRSDAGRGATVTASVELKGLDALQAQALRQASRGGPAVADLPAARPDLIERLRSEPDEQAHARLVAHVLGVLVRVRGHGDDAELEAGQTLEALGVDSLGGLALKSSLEQDLGLRLPMEVFLDATPDSLAQALLVRLASAHPGARGPRGSAGGSARWFAHRLVRPQARWRLFCLPHGGEGASIYRDWPGQFPEHVEVCPIQLPGEEERHAEAPFESLDEAVSALHDALQGELERPFALYGHSYGALIAYRLTQRLSAQGPRPPEHLFVGAFAAPGRPNPILAAVTDIFARAGYATLPDDAALRALPDEVTRALLDFLITRLSSDTVFQGRDLARDLPLQQLRDERLPRLIAGLRLVASDTPGQPGTFDVPITAFHGQRDHGVELVDMEAWAALTSGACDVVVLPGDHFFLRRGQAQAMVIAQINRRLDLRQAPDGLALHR